MPVIQTRALVKLFRGSKGKNKNYIEIALRSKNNLLWSWPAGSDLPKFSGWKSVSLIYAPFAIAIDVKCEPLESLESQQTSCKQVTEGEGNVLWLAACTRFSVVFGSAAHSYSVHWFIVFMATNIRWLYSVKECQPCITIAVPCSIWVIYRKTHSVIKLLSLFPFFSL